MVDVGGDDGAAAGDFGADEVGGDEGGDFGAEVFSILPAILRPFGHGGAADVFAVRDIGHLGGDDAGAGILELGDGPHLVPLIPAKAGIRGGLRGLFRVEAAA